MVVSFPPAANQRGHTQIDAPLEVLAGAVPTGLAGAVFGLAPIGGALTNTPFLNGDALYYRIDFGAGAATLHTRVSLDTTGVAERGAALEGGAWPFGNFGITRISPRLGARTFSNTALVPVRLPWSGEVALLATYDAGRPHYLDPATLSLVAPLGELRWWRANLLMKLPFKQVFSSAHPAYDANTEELFVVNHGRSIKGLIASLTAFLHGWLPWGGFGHAPDAADPAEEPGDSTRLSTLREALSSTRDRLANALAPLSPAVGDDDARAALAHFGSDAAPDERDATDTDPPSGVFGRFKEKLAFLEWAFGFVKLMTEFSADGPLADERPDAPFSYLLRWKADGTPQRFELRVDGVPLDVTQSAHQMAVTDRYVVFVDAAFKLDLTVLTSIPDSVPASLVALFRKGVARPQSDKARFYFVDRKELDRADLPSNGHPSFPASVVAAQSVTLDGEVIHFHVDYETLDGQVVLHALHQNAMDGAEFVLRGDRRWDKASIAASNFGTFPTSMSVNMLGRYEIDPARGVVGAPRVLAEPALTWALGLATGSGMLTGHAPTAPLREMFVYSVGLVPDLLTELVYELYQSYPNRDAANLTKFLAQGGLPARLLRVDVDAMTVRESFALRPDQQLVSPQFVPAAGDAGFVVCNVFSGPDSIAAGSRAREVWIFAADAIAAGPVCRLSHADLDWGYTLHTAWLPAVAPLSPSERFVTPASDLAVALADPDFREFFLKYLAPS